MSMHRFLVLLLFVSALAMTGCEEAVDPVEGSGEHFTLYGFLDPSAEIQSLRVYPIAEILASETGEPLDAVIRSTHRASGESIVWKDSVVQFFNGSLGHVYRAPFRPEFGTDYTIEAMSSGGELTTVDVTTPPDVEPIISNVVAASGLVRVDVDWPAAPHILESRLWYNVFYSFGADTARVRVPVTGPSAVRTNSGVLRTGILPSQDIGTIYLLLSLTPGLTKIHLVNIEAEAFVASTNWESPTGTFDSNVLIQPGTFSNVNGGFGFVSGGYTEVFVLELTDEQAELAGFAAE